MWDDSSHPLDQLLPAEGRTAVRAEGDTVVAVYKAGFAGQNRCFDLTIGRTDTRIDERSC